MRERTEASILAALQGLGEASAEAIADALGVSRPAVARHLPRLVAQGLLQARREVRRGGGIRLVYALATVTDEPLQSPDVTDADDCNMAGRSVTDAASVTDAGEMLQSPTVTVAVLQSPNVTDATARPGAPEGDVTDDLAWRVAAMRRLIPARGPIPFLRAREGIAVREGCCLSCGEPVSPGRLVSCDLCVEARRLALGDAA